MQRTALQQRRVLAQPALDGIEAGNVVERERRLDELEQPLTLALDQVLLDPAEPRRGQPLAVAQRQGDGRAGTDATETSQPLADNVHGHVCLLRQVRELGRGEHADVFHHPVTVGQRQVQGRRVRVLHDERIQVVQPFAHEDGDDVGLGNCRIVGPAQHLDNVGREGSSELQGVTTRHHELGKLDDHGDPSRGRRAVGNRPQVQGAQQITVDQLERRPRLAQQHLIALVAERIVQPGRPVVASPRRPHAAAAVVAQDHVVAGKHDLVEERRQGDHLRAGRDEIEDVAVQQKLGGGSGAKQIPHLPRPFGQLVAVH